MKGKVLIKTLDSEDETIGRILNFLQKHNFIVENSEFEPWTGRWNKLVSISQDGKRFLENNKFLEHNNIDLKWFETITFES
jgi:DNA-binding PadR family transcriptional regulator